MYLQFRDEDVVQDSDKRIAQVQVDVFYLGPQDIGDVISDRTNILSLSCHR